MSVRRRNAVALTILIISSGIRITRRIGRGAPTTQGIFGSIRVGYVSIPCSRRTGSSIRQMQTRSSGSSVPVSRSTAEANEASLPRLPIPNNPQSATLRRPESRADPSSQPAVFDEASRHISRHPSKGLLIVHSSATTQHRTVCHRAWFASQRNELGLQHGFVVGEPLRSSKQPPTIRRSTGEHELSWKVEERLSNDVPPHHIYVVDLIGKRTSKRRFQHRKVLLANHSKIGAKVSVRSMSAKGIQLPVEIPHVSEFTHLRCKLHVVALRQPVGYSPPRPGTYSDVTSSRCDSS